VKRLSSSEKKFRLFRAWWGGHPVWCTWQITYRCNYRCSFCHYWRDPMGELPEQPLEEIRIGARKLAQTGSLLISIAGGEPLLRNDIVEVSAAIAQFHLPFITTNGWDATDELARDLFNTGLWGVSVSLDYADAARHDKARGREGAFDRAIRALAAFARARRYDYQRVNLMAVLLQDNLDDMEPLIRLAAEYDAYFMVQPYGQRKTGSRRFVHERDSVVQRLLSLKRQYPNFLSNRHFLSQFDAALNGGVPGCRAGRAFFNIDSCGDVAICVEERARPVANLYQDSMADIRRALRGAACGNACTDCWYNCRGEVEMLYDAVGIWRSLPSFLFNRGRPRQRPQTGGRSCPTGLDDPVARSHQVS
jgi:MoaA/NifB/PqqE/SkfB family radical SAM enzyme